MKICIVGAGAIGASLGGILKKNGADIEFVCKSEDVKQRAESTGVHISGIKGNFDVVVPARLKMADLKEKKDIIIISTKAYDLEKLGLEALAHLSPNGLIVSMQNGICADIMEKAVGAEKAVLSAVTYGATLNGPADTVITSTGGFVIGKLDGKKPQLLYDLCDILNESFECKISNNILEELYSKLIINSCITAVGAVCGLSLGKMLSRKLCRKIFLNIIREAMFVANAMQLSVPPFGGKLDYYKLLSGNSMFDNLRRHIILKVVGNKYKNLKSSSLQSLEKGQPTEIDFFAGYICEKGKQYSVATPTNDVLYAMVKDIERGKRPISPDNLKELLL